jgi:hypothetical protein
MIDKNELTDFLVRVKQNSYTAGEKAKKIKMQDGAAEITHAEKNWKYKDRYYGGEPFCGGEVVSEDGTAVWVMNFYVGVREIPRSVSGSCPAMNGLFSKKRLRMVKSLFINV